MSITHSDFTIERHYGHSPQEAFTAFADPELKRRWFGNPGTGGDGGYELDFRVGGHELNSGGPEGGPVHHFRSRYHDIVPDERIVFAYDLLLGDQLVSVSLTTIEFHPDGDGTRLVFTEQGAFFDGLDDPAGREHGTGKLLDALESFLDAQGSKR